LAKEKAAKSKVTPPKEKKKVSKKKAEPKVAKPAAPTKAKAASKKKVVKTKAQPVKKKPVAKKKAKEKAAEPAASPAKEKKAEPEVAEPSRGELAENPMLKPRLEKVTVNMSVGQSGKPLEQAATILQQLTNQKPSRRQAKKTIREFGIRKGESIACLVTLRNKKAEEFLRKALQAVDNKLSKYCFDRQGNFSFGIKEHIDIPGTKYMPDLGIHGMDISVSLGRAGYRVKRRHRVKSRIGKDHLLTADEAVLFIKDEFDVEIT